ncbi:hypothetical protein FACS1894186_6490 [Alphaproteobacteria bacterium]|nr:hypothetical protein FACS1894186_6490 [Alphaproteobacteria bacterium]
MAEIGLMGGAFGLATAFFTRAATAREYAAHAVASALVLIPAGLLLEGCGVAPFVRYGILAMLAPVSMPLFIGVHRLAREFSAHPAGWLLRALAVWRKR